MSSIKEQQNEENLAKDHFNSWRSDEFGKFLEAHREKLKNICAPIYWYDRTMEPLERKITGGTCFFLKSEDNKLFLVTAKHVVQELLDSQAHNPESFCCQVGSLILEGSSFKLHESLDIAVAKLRQSSLDILDKTPVNYNIVASQVTEGAHVIICGFPGEFREVESKAIEFFMHTYASHVSASYEDQFKVQSHLDSTVVDQFQINTNKKGLMPESLKTASMGGVSGGPVFQSIKKEGTNDHYEYRLSGVVTEQQASLGQFIGVPFSAFTEWLEDLM